jgi:heterodisulfide reductase subunit A
MRHFTDEQILAQIDAFSEHGPEKKILAFNCNWCSYAGADFAGVSRMQYPPEVRIIRTMCSGRVSTRFIEHAFSRGVAIVLISGCHIGDCHYINANTFTEKRYNHMRKIMKQGGLDIDRLHLVWISASEGQRFQEKVEELKRKLMSVPSIEIRKGIRYFKERKENRKEKSKKPIPKTREPAHARDT